MLESTHTKVAGLKTFIKKTLQYRCFRVKFIKIIRNTYFEEHLRKNACANTRKQIWLKNEQTASEFVLKIIEIERFNHIYLRNISCIPQIYLKRWLIWSCTPVKFVKCFKQKNSQEMFCKKAGLNNFINPLENTWFEVSFS